MAFRSLLLLLILLIVHACATVPVTGRKQLSLISNDEMIQLSTQQYQQVLSEGKLSADKAKSDMIKSVGLKIQVAVEKYMTEKGVSAELRGFKWEFNLLDDPTVNAWCMPGGKVAFYTGILPICKDEDGVAVVMGHEVAHAIANHGRERMSQGLMAQLGLGTVSGAMGENPNLTRKIFMEAMGIGAQVGMLKFSRQHESEADHIGLIFMSMAGYDPNHAPLFWERMSTMSGGQAPPEWLSTHPSHQTRINDLKNWIPEAMEYYKK